MQNYHLRQIFRCFTLKQQQIFLFRFNVFMIFVFKYTLNFSFLW